MPTLVPNVTNGDTLLDTWGDAVRQAIEELQATPPNHGSRHQPGGADALPTAAAGASAPSDAAAVGTSTSLARADHKHSRGAEYTTGRVWVPATAFWPSTTSGATALTTGEFATNKVNSRYLTFPNGALVHAEAEVLLPHWNAGTFTASIYCWWASQFFNTVWGVAAISLGTEGDIYDQAFGTRVDVSTANGGIAANRIHQATSAAITASGTPAQTELVHLRVSRGNITGDDLPASAFFMGVRIDYTRVA